MSSSYAVPPVGLQELRGAGLSCQPYHADMEPARRQAVHMQWSQGKVQVRLLLDVRMGA